MSHEHNVSFEPDYAVPAGETVKESMESMGITQKEFAIRLGMTEQSLIRMYTGKQALTFETANRLEKVTGVSASFWNRREQLYRERLTRLKEAELAQKSKQWVHRFPLKMMQAKGIIPESKDITSVYSSLLRFFGVATEEAWDKLWLNPKVAARRSPCFDTDPHKAAVWIRMGELAAEKLRCKATDKLGFSKLLPSLRSLTRKDSSTFLHDLQKRCCDVGVALVFVETPPGLKWNGATKWLHDTALIILNAKNKKENVFWFSFFHEAYHVLNDGKQNLLINVEKHMNGHDNSTAEREKNAENFAIRNIFGQNVLKNIELASNEQDIHRLAEKVGVSEGVVAGQWQFLHKNFSRFNDIIRRIEPEHTPSCAF